MCNTDPGFPFRNRPNMNKTALIAALIAVVIITVLGTVGTNLNARLEEVATGLEKKGE